MSSLTEARDASTGEESVKPDLTLLSGDALGAIARAMEAGNAKGSRVPDDWRNDGFDQRKFAAKVLRHTYEWLEGKDLDEESGESPLAHAAADLIFILHHIENQTGQDTRSPGGAEIVVYAKGPLHPHPVDSLIEVAGQRRPGTIESVPVGGCDAFRGAASDDQSA